MRTKKVSRHYCDFCSKGGFQIPAMRKHESRCCRNPKRSCGVCQAGETDVEKNAKILINDGIEALKTETNSCPACVLAAHIIANKLSGFTPHAKFPVGEYPEFFYYADFKTDLKNWMDERRREEMETIAGVFE